MLNMANIVIIATFGLSVQIEGTPPAHQPYPVITLKGPNVHYKNFLPTSDQIGVSMEVRTFAKN